MASLLSWFLGHKMIMDIWTIQAATSPFPKTCIFQVHTDKPNIEFLNMLILESIVKFKKNHEKLDL